MVTGKLIGTSQPIEAGTQHLYEKTAHVFSIDRFNNYEYRCKEGDLILVADSHWRLSLAVNEGSAAGALMLEVGDEVRIEDAKKLVS